MESEDSLPTQEIATENVRPENSLPTQELATTSSTGPVKRKLCSSVSAATSSTHNNSGTTTPPAKKRSRPRSALSKSKKKRSNADSPSVQFGHVRVREHRRTLGGSCGVPYTGSISLGLSNEYQDFKAVDIDVYERIRQSEGRCLQETPEKVRRMLLEADMGSENFEKRLREEQTSLARTRIYREDSVANDSRYLETFQDNFGNEVHIGLDPCIVDRNSAVSSWLGSAQPLAQPDADVTDAASPTEAAQPATCSLQSLGFL